MTEATLILIDQLVERANKKISAHTVYSKNQFWVFYSLADKSLITKIYLHIWINFVHVNLISNIKKNKFIEFLTFRDRLCLLWSWYKKRGVKYIKAGLSADTQLLSTWSFVFWLNLLPFVKLTNPNLIGLLLPVKQWAQSWTFPKM